jgi:predicted GNAT superfamily acetyltransferase
MSERDPMSSKAEIHIRKCANITELEACVALQKEVWNFSDMDLVPLRMFVVADKVGGQVLGAFHGDKMIGFAMAVPGTRGGHAYLHSHMLAVRADFRNSGIGRRLKLAQRDDALARGIALMEWTFDPLEIKNAWLNIVRLGAIARRYNINQYGITSSPLQGGLPSDRLVAEWWLDSRRVHTALAGEPLPIRAEKRITVLAEVYEWKSSDDWQVRQKLKDLQLSNREEFLKSFAADFAVLGFERNEKGDGSYLLGHGEESFGAVLT